MTSGPPCFVMTIRFTSLRSLQDAFDGRGQLFLRFFPRPTFHDLRRTFLSRLATGRLTEGSPATPVPPTVLIRISGHEDVQTLLEYYTVAGDEEVCAAMAGVP